MVFAGRGDGAGGGLVSAPAAAPQPNPAPEEQSGHDMSAGLETVTFTDAGSLGLCFAENRRSGAVEILAVIPNVQASRFPHIQVGMLLTAVGNQSIAGMKYADVIAMIKKQGRPLTMVFAGRGDGAGGGLVSAPAAAPPPNPAPEDEIGPPPPINAAGSAVEQTVVALYTRYNPEKISDVPKLMKKDGEDELLRMVRKKYAKQEKKRQQEVVALQKWLTKSGITVSSQQVVDAFDSAGFKPAEWIATLENMPAAELEEFVVALTSAQ